MSATPENAGHVHHLLPALLNSSLSLAERERVTNHVKECAECRADLAFSALVSLPAIPLAYVVLSRLVERRVALIGTVLFALAPYQT